MRKPKVDRESGDYTTWVYFDVMANYHVRIVFAKDLFKSAKHWIGSSPHDNADAFCYHVKDEGRSYIFLGLNSTESTVAHECWHIVHRVLTYCGVADMDDEVVAYHLDHLVEKVYEFKKAIQSKGGPRDLSNSRAGRKKRS